MPIGRAALEELRLKLQAKQAAVRAEVQREQDEVLQVGAGLVLVLGWMFGCARAGRAAGGCWLHGCWAW